METKPTIYTEEFVTSEVEELKQQLLTNKEIVFIGELLEHKTYSRQRLSEWASLGGEISDTISKIKDILETRAITGGLKNKLNASITKFHLINNFDWKDKQETDITSGGDKLEPIQVRIINDKQGDSNSS